MSDSGKVTEYLSVKIKLRNWSSQVGEIGFKQICFVMSIIKFMKCLHGNHKSLIQTEQQLSIVAKHCQALS